MSALTVESVAEPFIRRRAIRHLEKGRVVILAAGTGRPHFTTDTAAALNAIEIRAGVVMKATKVDGVYDCDPNRNRKAKRYKTISYMDVINKHLKIMDITAISMCMEQKLPVLVFNMWRRGNIVRAIRGQDVGTLVGDVETSLA
jgi:uridylate kinase